ncbi:MAG: CorA family divalent cation transporter [Rhodospirillaceae bacterium]
MMTLYKKHDDRLVVVENSPSQNALTDALWIDLFNPSGAEIAQVEGLLGISLPTSEDTKLLAPADRSYQDGNCVVLTAAVLARDEELYPFIDDLTFVVSKTRLVTLRTSEPLPISRYATACAERPHNLSDGRHVFLGLLTAFINRLSEYVQANGASMYEGSKRVFADRSNDPISSAEFQTTVSSIGRNSDVNAKARESLLNVGLLIDYVGNAWFGEEDIQRVLTDLRRDVTDISEYASFIASQRAFLLSAVLGLLTLEQSRVTKILSIAATVFLPPTLIASIYGMNFKVMPELSSPWGYPAALALMLLSAVVPYLFFRWKKWL